MEKTLWLDLETRSGTDIEFGAYRYAEDPRCEVLLFAYAVDEAPAKVAVWPFRGKGLPEDLEKALTDPSVTLIAHNSNFDRTLLRRWRPEVGDPSRWKDSMVLALSCGLPGHLMDLCRRFKLPEDKAKDAVGKRLIRKYCVPQKDGTFIETNPLDADDWNRFVEYCRLDVEAMREVWKRTPKDNDTDAFWDGWRLDQRINDRGIRIDRKLVDGCVKACSAAQTKAASDIGRLTGGRVSSVGQRARIISELASLGVHMPDLQQSTVEHRLADPSLPPLAREILTSRLLGGKSSVSKFSVLQGAVCSDGRLHGTLQFCGASRTGRWSGRLFQPQNLPRGTLHGEEVETAIDAFRSGCAELVYDDVLAAASSCIRGCVIPSDGSHLVVADLSNIEGRVLAWLAGEQWKLDAFSAYDRGAGPDIYKATYARTFGGRPEDVKKPQRQVGKVLELAMGYAGGVGAFHTFASQMGVDMEGMARMTLEGVGGDLLEDLESAWAQASETGYTCGMTSQVWMACELVKRRWREAHPMTQSLWKAAETGVISCLEGRGDQRVGPRCTMMLRPGGLVARLPSGRCIRWPGAQKSKGKGVIRFLDAQGWTETFGGRIVENLTQAVARDILAEAMTLAETRGFHVVMHVHDELICEASPDGRHGDGQLSAVLATVPAWASGLPLSAAGFTGMRYRKD